VVSYDTGYGKCIWRTVAYVPISLEQHAYLKCIGITNEGYQYPHFLDWGYSNPHFSGQVKHLLSSEAISGDQIALKPFSVGVHYLEIYSAPIIFAVIGSAPDPITRELLSKVSFAKHRRSLREGLQG